MRSLPVDFFTFGTHPKPIPPPIRLFRNFGKKFTLITRQHHPVTAKRPTERMGISDKIEHHIQTPDLFRSLFAWQYHNRLGQSLLQTSITGNPDTSKLTHTEYLIVRNVVAVKSIEPQQPQILRDFGKMNITDKTGTTIPSDIKSLHGSRHTLL